MQLHDMKSHVERSGDGVESSFVIKNSAKAFTILSSTLYSDKIGAIVRELSCNAYDAHVAVGKGDVPFEIKLPNSLDPTFYVKDFGPGLSDAQIIGETVDGVFHPGIYQTFFDSSKTDSDAFIGALGLGCKSPFSYTSMFMVESRQNGVKKTYTAFKDEFGKPAIRFMNAEQTTEGDGLTVSLSVKKDDAGKFVSAAKRQLMYFNPKPVVKGHAGFKTYDIKHTTTGTNWKLREVDSYANMSGPQVVQGFVVYPVDGGILRDRKIPASVSTLLGIDIDLFVPIGQVEPAPSREALSYDDVTVNNLVNVLKVAADEMHSSFQKQFDDCKTYWDACVQLNTHESGSYSFRDMFKSLHKMKAFTWKGRPLHATVELILDKVKDTSILVYEAAYKNDKLTRDGQWSPADMKKKFDFTPRKSIAILIDESVKGNNPTILKYLKDTKDISKVIVLRPTQGHKYNQQEVDDIVKQLGSPFTINVSLLPTAVSTVKSTYVKRAPEEKMVWIDFPEGKDTRGRRSGKRREFSRLCWKREMIDLNAGGFYVNVDRFTITDKSANSFDTMIDLAVQLGILSTKPFIVGFNEKDLQQVNGIAGWINIVAHIETIFKANQQDYWNFLAYQDICDNVPAMAVAKTWTQWNGNFIDGAFKKYIESLIAVIPSRKYEKESVVRLAGLLPVTIPANKHHVLKAQWNNIVNRYSMLKYVNVRLDGCISDIATYVNAVDKP